MSSIGDQIKKIKGLVPLTKRNVIILILLAIFLVWGGARSCSRINGLDPSKVFVIARDQNWYPLNLMGKEKAILAFSNEILLAIAKKEGLKLELVTVSADSLFANLEKGKYDAILSALTPSDFNKNSFAFSDPFLFIGPVLVVPANSTITSLSQLNKKIIGVRRGAHIVFDISEYDILFTPYDNMNTAFSDLEKGRLAGIIMPALQAQHFILSKGGKAKVVSTPLTNEGLRIVAKPGTHSDILIEKYNHGLKELKEEGTYDKLLHKWGLSF
jgi:polar amino acid transport system substrate-binding protein